MVLVFGASLADIYKELERISMSRKKLTIPQKKIILGENGGAEGI